MTSDNNNDNNNRKIDVRSYREITRCASLRAGPSQVSATAGNGPEKSGTRIAPRVVRTLSGHCFSVLPVTPPPTACYCYCYHRGYYIIGITTRNNNAPKLTARRVEHLWTHGGHQQRRRRQDGHDRRRSDQRRHASERGVSGLAGTVLRAKQNKQTRAFERVVRKEEEKTIPTCCWDATPRPPPLTVFANIA